MVFHSLSHSLTHLLVHFVFLSQNILMDKQLIYKDSYQGWYSVSDETFLSDTHVTDGPTPGTKVGPDLYKDKQWSIHIYTNIKKLTVEAQTEYCLIYEQTSHCHIFYSTVPLKILCVLQLLHCHTCM